jgi:hypothetical protein
MRRSAKPYELEQVVENEGVDPEHRRDDDGEPGQVPLHDVRSALRLRREPEPAHASLAARVHEDERDQEGGDQNLEDRRYL